MKKIKPKNIKGISSLVGTLHLTRVSSLKSILSTVANHRLVLDGERLPLRAFVEPPKSTE